MFIHRIKLQNILSFGPDTQELELAPLNVLIGPNGSGKSNLIEVVGLLRAAPTDLSVPLREGGSGVDWIWRGEQEVSDASVEVIAKTLTSGNSLLRYALEFYHFSFVDGLMIGREIVEDEQPKQGIDNAYRYFDRGDKKISLSYRDESGGRRQRDLSLTDVEYGQTVLAQFKDPVQYPELTFLGNKFSRIRLYREWSFGRSTPPRLPQMADLPNDILSEDGKNLGMVLNRLKSEPKAKSQLLGELRKLYEGLEDFDVIVQGGTVQVFLQEGNITIPATRLSDGTLRYLCLLAILCHPEPPPLVCIEEPELGLHPDILPGLAELLREASQRCQLIVTTHSDILVDALTDTPESVVVCEKENGQTAMKRFGKQELAGWLEKYSLGDYWMRGGMGGTRW